MPVLVAVVASWVAPSLTLLVPLAAVLVAVLLLRASWTIIKPVLQKLLEVCNPLLIKQVHNEVEARPEVNAVYGVHCRRVGGAIFVNLKLLVDPDMTLMAAHELPHDIERQLKQQHPELIEVLCYVGPGMDHD